MKGNPVWARRIAGALCLAGSLGAGLPNAFARTPPRRVVSANLCADQLLLALADPAQIASLSPFAADSSQSFLAKEAQRFPRNRETGEDIVARRADLVLTGPYDSRATRDLLAASGVTFDVIAPWRTFADGYAQIRELATRLGHADRGEALIAAIRGALNRLPETASARGGRGPTGLVLGRGGYVFEGGVLWAILRKAGLRDAAPDLGLSGSGFAQLEALVATRPDYLILSDASASPRDEGEAFLLHPALKALYPPRRTLFIPERLTQCDGPSTPALIEAVAAEVAAAVE